MSLGLSGDQLAEQSGDWGVALDATGNLVVYSSVADADPRDDVSAMNDVYLADRAAGTREVVSLRRI